jgi:hypothetical protein
MACQHPDREALEADLTAGASLRGTADKWGVNRVGLARHREAHMAGPENDDAVKIEPWERRRESRPAFEAFAKYRDMGVKRSTARVAREAGKHKSQIDRWSSAHDWVQRADAFDREQDRVWRLEQHEARREVARKHTRVGAAMLGKAVQRLQSIDVDKLTPNELERWVRTAAELERSAFGEAEVTATGLPLAVGMITELVQGLRRGGTT